MFKIKGYIFHHDKDSDRIAKINISTVPGCENLTATGYEDAYTTFEGIPYFMFLLSPIKEETE